MSWTGRNGIDKLSLFNEDSFAGAISNDNGDFDGYAVIRLVPQFNRFGNKDLDPAVLGVVTEGVEFNIESNYTDMGSLSLIGDALSLYNGKTAGMNSFESIMGLNSQSTVFSSQLVYQKSGYLRIKPRMRVVDWNGVGQPILTSLLLSYYSLPANNWDSIKKDINEMKENFLNKLNPWVEKITSNKVGELLVKGYRELEEGAKIVKSKVEETASTVKDYVNNNPEYLAPGVNNTKGAINLLKKYSSPVPMKVTIGQFFYKENMVIENVNFAFSKECSDNGPLWVDIDIDLCSLTILQGIDDVGLKIANSGESRLIDMKDFGSNATGL